MDWSWLVPVGSLCLAVCGFFVLRRAARRELDRLENVGRICAVCGYDLRATPNRCPECGTVVPPGLPLRLRFDVKRLANDWPIDPVLPRSAEANEFPVLLLDTQDQWQAKLLVDQLRARGVEARVTMGRPIRTGDFFSPGQVTFAKVIIWSQDIDQAMAIAQTFSSEPAGDAPAAVAEQRSTP